MRRHGWLALCLLGCAAAHSPAGARASRLRLNFRIEGTSLAYEAGVCACVAMGCLPEPGGRTVFLTATRYDRPIRGGVLDIPRPTYCGDRNLVVEVQYEVATRLECRDAEGHQHFELSPGDAEIELPAHCERQEIYGDLSQPPHEQGVEGATPMARPCTFRNVPSCLQPPFPRVSP